VTAYVPGVNEADLKKIVTSLQQLAAGRSNAVGTVTLTVSTGTTTVIDANAAVNSTILFSPRSANAAAEIGNGTMYVSAHSDGSFTITHANSATTGRTFRYAIHG
jgi:hypothetical protein